eukprot:jgi/Botrbrau1/8655/Bobra.0087s0009.1
MLETARFWVLGALVVLHVQTIAGQAPKVVNPLPPVVESVSEQVDPFTAIEACLPFNIAIAPGRPDNYTIVAVGESPVLDSINFSVSNGTLQLSTDGDFNTTGSVELAVFLPADQLEALTVSSVGEVTILPGFSAPSFTLSSAFGSGDINVIGFDTEELTIENCRVSSLHGVGRIIYNGTIGDANISASGTSVVYVLTINGTTTVNLAGTASVIVGTTNDGMITGQATGVNTVAYRRGTCEVQSPFSPVFAPCTPVRSLRVPAIQPLWSCGLAVEGNFTCSAGAAPSVDLTEHLKLAARRVNLECFNPPRRLSPEENPTSPQR